MPETCLNCNRSIGQLETAHVWREQIVCVECLGRLRSSEIGYAPAAPTLADVMRSVADPDAPQIAIIEAPETPRPATLEDVLSEHRRATEKAMYRGRRSIGAALFLCGVLLLFCFPPAGIVLLVVGFLVWAAGVKL
jgi:hypothetical protein